MCTRNGTLASRESTGEVLKALDNSASALRTKLGESLASVDKVATPIAEATTSSLETLNAYSMGGRKSLLQESRRVEAPALARHEAEGAGVRWKATTTLAFPWSFAPGGDQGAPKVQWGAFSLPDPSACKQTISRAQRTPSPI